MISNYTIPFSFLINLQFYTQCPEYVSAVCDLITDMGGIDFTIFDSKEVIVNTETNTYTLNTKEEVEVSTDSDADSASDSGSSSGTSGNPTINHGSSRTPSSRTQITRPTLETPQITVPTKPTLERPQITIPTAPGTSSGGTSSSGNSTGESSSGETTTQIVTHSTPVTEVTTTTTTITTVTADVTKADVWVIYKETNYTKLPDETQETMNITNKIDDEDEPEGLGSWKTGQSQHVVETNTSGGWQQEDSKTEIKPDKFLGLWKNTTGLYIKGATYNPKGIQVKYGLPFTKSRKSPLENLFSADAMFCDVLEKNEETQLHAQIMKELIKYYKANGDYEINVDFSVMDTSGFDEVFDLYGNNAEERIWFALLDAGYDEYAVAGAMGNFKRESGCMFNNVENCVNEKSGLSDEEFTEQVNNGTISKEKFIKCYEWGEVDKNGQPTGAYGYGIAQWTWWSYKEDLYDLAKQKGVGIDDESLQIEYLLKQMKEKGYSKTQTSPSDAAYKFQKQIEGSADGEAGLRIRANYAEEIYKKYHGKEKPDVTDPNVEANGSIPPSYRPYIEYKQGDYSKTPPSYNATGSWGSIAQKGCMPTSFAIIASGYGLTSKNGKIYTPATIVTEVHNNTSSYSTAVTVGRKLGLKVGPYKSTSGNAQAILKHLETGHPILVHATVGYYTRGGHYMTLIGVKGNKVYLSNPGNRSKTGWVDINLLISRNVDWYATISK